MKAIKALVITTFGETEIIDLSVNELGKLQDNVGGYVEVVNIGNDLLLWVNEEGKVLKLPHNRYAQAIWQKYYGLTDYIVGNVVVTGMDDNKGYTISLTRKQIADILLVVHEAASNGVSYATDKVS